MTPPGVDGRRRGAVWALALAIGAGCDGNGPTKAERPFEVVALEIEREGEPVTSPLSFRLSDDPTFTLQVFGIDPDGNRMALAAVGESPTNVLIGVQDRAVIDFDQALGQPPGLLGYVFTIEGVGTTTISFVYQPPGRLGPVESVEVVVLPAGP